MPKFRTIPQAVEIIKQQDPDAHISVDIVRKWCKRGQLKYVKSGSHFIIDAEALENLLQLN